MGATLTVFVLLLLAAGLFYGGRALRKSRTGGERLSDLVREHPQGLAFALLLAIAALIALGVLGLISGF